MHRKLIVKILAAALTAAGLFLSLQGCSLLPTRGEENNSAADASVDLVPVTAEIAVDLTKNAQASATPPQPEKPKSKSLRTPASAGTANSDSDSEAKSAHRAHPKKRAAEGEIVQYTVKNNDTLMKVAFEVLGNVYRWHEIYEQNREKIGKFNSLVPGTTLTIRSAGAVSVTKSGDPYLIKHKDTLWKISDNIYGTPWKWSRLWNNNRELIHDPNHIYAGFYLYYLMTDEERNQRHLLLGNSRIPASN
ncbi:MAG: LysM peptidoglycan-binding domain-containing protein [Oligoflexia bacterium]|nr:LysM peptidoglycan-binding domain-containing protein [Oligoflexia bacterium]